MKVVVIDTETADAKRDSICALAVVVIDEGKIVAEWSSLIRPPRPPAPANIEVHGLTMQRLAGAPPFAVAWARALPLLEGANTLVAHNAKFDQSVLDAACQAAGLALPVGPWTCTVTMARSAWPQLASHKLNVVAEHLGLDLQHHDALSDARACARIYLAARAVQDARAARPAAPMVPRIERAGQEGAARWCWTIETDRAELRLGDKGLVRLRLEEPQRWALTVGKHALDIRIGPEALGRLDELLLEALRVGVAVAKLNGVKLSPETWLRIVEARPRRRPVDGALDVVGTGAPSTPTPAPASAPAAPGAEVAGA